ncbi:hypothetical protein [Methylobacterium sp. WL19]|uniref:hypothetical protein n=1 Tax=Methylobacterium sp. WL19 TaxID=2603896 RepID=UPI0011C6FF0F|nr:hypothetical protein [Methylobacterium sp. WL19]TXN21895.1 hypothetical protein FV220_22555 [Methylobacterium sp. WL19]
MILGLGGSSNYKQMKIVSRPKEKSMSRFTDLQQQHSAWRNAHWEYRMNCSIYMNAFTNQFRKYIEAPEYYDDYSDGVDQPKKVKYVAVAEAEIKSDGFHKLTEIPATQTTATLVKADNGRWVAGIKLVVDMAVNSYPKSAYFFPIEFEIEGNICRMEIGGETGGQFTYDVSDPSGPHEAFDYMIGWLGGVYASKPWETSKKGPMGFVVNGSR